MFVNKNWCISHTFRNSSISLNAKLVINRQVLPNVPWSNLEIRNVKNSEQTSCNVIFCILNYLPIV